MKDLVNDFRVGNTTQRVAIVADLASLLGISAVAMAAGIFSFAKGVEVGTVVFAAAQSVVFIGGLAILAAAYWLVSRVVGLKFQDAPFPQLMFKIAVACVFISVVLVCGLIFYDYLASFRYVVGGV